MKIEGLATLAKLQTLDLGHNQIAHMENVGALQELEEFWCGGNKLESWHELEVLRQLPKISCVYLEFNPLASETAYRRKLKLLLPTLKQIDAVLCG